MEILFLLIGMPVIAYVGLAAVPAGKPVLYGYLAFVAFMGLWYLVIHPTTGLDRAYFLLGYLSVIIAACAVIPCQLWRYWCLRTGRRPYYLVVLSVPVIVCLVYVNFFVQ